MPFNVRIRHDLGVCGPMQAALACEYCLGAVGVDQPAKVGQGGPGRCQCFQSGSQLRKLATAQAVEGSDRNDGGAVPVAVEDGLGLRDARAEQEQVHVVEIRRLRGGEVGVTDIPSADDGHPPVGDPRLVVHPACRAECPEQQLEAALQSVGAAAAGVEQPQLDIRVAVEGKVDRVVAPRIDVVQQQPDAHAAVGGGDDFPAEQAARQVVLPVVVLQVEATAGAACAMHAGREGVEVPVEQDQPGPPRMAPEHG